MHACVSANIHGMHACVQEPELDPVTGRISVRLGQNVAEMISILVGTRSVDQVRSHAQVPRHSDNLHCTIAYHWPVCHHQRVFFR